jgi:hypothetical protein
MQRPVVKALHFHGGLVGFDIGDNVSDGHFIPYFFPPLDQGALGHRVG